MKLSEKKYKRITVKVGSSLFCLRDNTLDVRAFNNIAGQIADLVKQGYEVVVVSSGAIALGMQALGLKKRPGDLANLQAAAAVGQNQLMNLYGKFFQELGIKAGQVLLTWEDFNDRRRYLNAKNTLLALLKAKAVPIINENDTVSTDEIKFGDNDRLSALVSSLVSSNILIILSDIDGLMDENRKTVIRLVDDITPEIKSLASPSDKLTSVGGMITKIEAAKIAVDSGIPCVIANGRKKDIIFSAINQPEKAGTLFISKKSLNSRKRWIAFSTKPKGKVIVDEGAKNALINKKSLLSVGVYAIEGAFEADDIVSVMDKLHSEFARGRVGFSSRQLDKVKGSRMDKEVIHRDNIVIL